MSNERIPTREAASAKIERFEQLQVWRKSHALVLEIYQKTRALPEDERFGLVSQMRRSAVSIPANIAEGFKRRGTQDKARFYNISQASLEELRYYCILCHDLGYPIDVANLALQSEDIGRMLTRLIQSVAGRRG